MMEAVWKGVAATRCTALRTSNGDTYQCVLSLHILVREAVAVVVDQIKWTANLWLANALCLLRYALPCHALFLVGEVGVQAGAGADEEDGGRDVEGLSMG